MSVIKSLRSLSRLEYYKQAIKLRKDVTLWCMRDFGIKRNTRSVRQVIKNISSEDQEIIDNIFAKYGRGRNTSYQSEYPSWIIVNEKNVIIKILQSLIYNITSAENIPSQREEYQNKAINNCLYLYQELQYISSIFSINMNGLIIILEDIEKEISYLENWRDNKNLSD